MFGKLNEKVLKKTNNSNGIFKLSETLFIIGLIVFGVLFVYIWLAHFGNAPETYTDVVYEYTSIWNSNKSGERKLVYVLAILGSCAIFVYYSKQNRHRKILMTEKIEENEDKLLKVMATALIVSTAVYYFVYSGTSPLLISLLILLVIFYVMDKSLALSGTVFFVLCLYGAAGIYRVYVYLGGDNTMDIMTIVLLSLSVSLIILAISHKRRENLYVKGIHVIQLCIPFTLLLFLASNYKVGNDIVQLTLPKRIIYGIWLVIIWFEILSIRELKKSWCKSFETEEMITFGTLVCIMNFNNYLGSGQIISEDLHHPFENIIGFSQIMELGQKPFAEYIPVSGMYSYFQGFFLWLFGNRYYAYYYVTENLFYFAITIMIIWLLRKQLRNYGILFVTLLIPIIRYNRVALIIPVMLLLAWPKLIENKNLWLKAWMLSSLIHGLYYPLFGAAVCIGYLPLGIYQIVTYLQGDFSSDVKKKRFWVEWAASIVPVLLCAPLLFGTLKHMSAMGRQTVYADGISRFGQTLPDNFFSYIQSLGVRLLTYDVFTFLIQAGVVWVSALLVMKIGGIAADGKKLICSDFMAAIQCASFGIAILISFTYTLVRIDINSIYARSRGIIYGAVMMIIIICARYLKDSNLLYVFVGIAVFFVAAVSGEAVFNFGSANKLDAYYSVGEDYILVEGDRVPRLGKCYVRHDVYDNIVENYNGTRSADPDMGYLGIGNFGHYYLSEIKGDSVMEVTTIRGFDAAQETVDLIRKNDTVVAGVSSFSLYYLYHWLITSGEYIWSAEDGKFYPNTENLPVEEILEQNKYIGIPVEGRDLGRTPTSWGLSMKSLEKIFTFVKTEANWTQGDTSVDIRFGERINGEDADFIYLEFSGVDQNYENILFNHNEDVVQTDVTRFNQNLMKRDYNRGTAVTVTWADDAGNSHSISCSLGRGKLLLPMGCGYAWLLNGHDNITITAARDGEVIALPEIEDIRLLKLREVQ